MQLIYITKYNLHTFVLFFVWIFLIFQNSESILAFFGPFCIINRYFEYRIRILCIFLYMGTWCKDIFRHFSTPKIEFVSTPPNQNFSEKCEQFSYGGFLVLNGPKLAVLAVFAGNY